MYFNLDKIKYNFDIIKRIFNFIKPVDKLPQSITHLTFKKEFNKKINFSKLPKLKELTIDINYNYEYTVPINIKIIYL